MRIQTAALLALPLVLAGCASTVQINRDTAAALRGQTIVLTARPAPQMAVQSSGSAALGVFGAIGGIASASLQIDRGAAFVKQYQLTSPTDPVAGALARALRSQWGMQMAGPAVPVDDNDMPALAAKANGKARYVLDVITTLWMLDAIGGRAQYGHAARARLIDTRSGQVVADGTCSTEPARTLAELPTYDSVVANNAAVLKSQMNTVHEACVNQLRKAMFGT